MNNYKVSIIIPCYNIESDYTLFQNMFQSLIKQTFNMEDMEIIMVDDKSPDNTRKILEELQKQYNNIKIIPLKENGGVSNARNQAIKQSTADYVMFMDQDDKYSSDFVETAYTTITDNNIDFMLSNYIIHMNNTLTKFDTGCNEKIITNNKQADLQYATKFFWTGIYNRSFLIENNIFFPTIW
ncbi:glycosyltransferase family 2 protein [Methanosphaera sp.]